MLEGISKITTDDMKFAESIGCDIKLIALYESGTDMPVVYVAPALVDKSNLLYSVNGVFNSITLRTEFSWEKRPFEALCNCAEFQIVPRTKSVPPRCRPHKLRIIRFPQA